MQIHEILGLQEGFLVTATDVAKVSGKNQMKGIHIIENGEIRGVAILCTLDGENYKNEWIEENKILKYYLEGIKDRTTGIKKFNPDIRSNRSIIDSNDNYPLIVFIRNNKKDKYRHSGHFHFQELVKDDDDSMYFILVKERHKILLSNLLSFDETDEFPEGKEKLRLHKYKERNKNVIEYAKLKFKSDHFGELFCEVCGFNFKKAYGEIGEDYIEGHHIKPVSELNDGDKTKVEDILLVCSNCHKMLHRRRPWITKERLQEFINRNYVNRNEI